AVVVDRDNTAAQRHGQQSNQHPTSSSRLSTLLVRSSIAVDVAYSESYDTTRQTRYMEYPSEPVVAVSLGVTTSGVKLRGVEWYPSWQVQRTPSQSSNESELRVDEAEEEEEEAPR
ncbi:hypothetical protein QQX98_010421, partial [Neonectria punicea]